MRTLARLAGTLAIAGFVAVTASWAHAPKHKAAVVRATPAELAAYDAAKPGLQKHCFRCHTTKGMKVKAKALKHFNLDRYPPRGHHAHEAGAVVRRVLLGDKGKGEGPSMPSDDPGVVVGQELERIIAWADAFEKGRVEQAKASTASPTRGGTKPTDAGAATPHAH
jgi:hypothetical protein